ncbi:MAG: Ig-like domain-containing protein [Pseudomonadota bacterium]
MIFYEHGFRQDNQAISRTLDGQDISNDPSYAVDANGDLLKITATIDNGNGNYQATFDMVTGAESGASTTIIVNMVQSGSSWRAALSGIALGYAPPDTNTLAYALIQSRQGVITAMSVTPEWQGGEVVGQTIAESTTANGVLVSSKSVQIRNDPIAGTRSESTDTILFDLQTGAFASRSRSSTLTRAGNLLGRTEERLDADGAVLSRLVTTVLDAGKRVELFDGNGVLLQRSETVLETNGSLTTATYDGKGMLIVRSNSQTFEDDGSTAETIHYPDGRTVRTNAASDGTISSRTETVPTINGEIATTRYYTLGMTVRVALDRGGNVLERSETVYSSTGPAMVTVYDGAASVLGRGTLQTYEDGSASETVRYSDGRTIRTNTDQNGTVTSRASIQYFEEDNSSIETVTYADGRIVKLTYDGEGTLLRQEAVESGGQTLLRTISAAAPTLIDALSLVKAIQSGEPLPILASGLRLANDLSTVSGAQNLNLTGAANVASGILSLMSLDAALERGDTLGAITAGAQAISFSASAYVNFAAAELFEYIPSDVAGASVLSQSLGNALPYLNLVNSIAQGDTAGTAVAVASIALQQTAYAYMVPYIGWAYAVYSIVSSLFDDDEPPEAWGAAQAAWSGFDVVTSAAGEHGGRETAQGVMDQFIAALEQLAAREQALNPGAAVGVIANRLPSLTYRNYTGFGLTDIDPLSGAQRLPELRYDLSYRPYNAPPGSEQAGQSLSERFIRVALARGAIAPLWEVHTAARQSAAGDPQAGLTEEERAGRSGQLAAPVSGDTQSFRPVALDLDGDGVRTTGASRTVAFDVDGSGFYKNTAWLERDDGFLTLDRNLNGRIDSGRELFSNGRVGVSARGLAGLRWVDADYDGRITPADPVWEELKVWRDADGDGELDAGEAQSLAALGITSLNYAMGSFEQNGQLRQLASPDLAADTAGTRSHVVPEGIIVETSGGQVSLLVTRIDDRSALQAHADGVTTYEDTEAIISGADLLANDTLAGFHGQNLALTGVSGFTHGTGYLDANGFIHYTPEANYYGEASFNYQIQAPTGQTATGTVALTIRNLNDAPTATLDQHLQPIYGYQSYRMDEVGFEPTEPSYVPYTGYDYSSGSPVYGYHGTPIAHWDPDGVNNATVAPHDIDDPQGPFTFEVVQQPQKGEGRVYADGRVEYINWTAPGRPGVEMDESGTTEADPFIVRVTDPHGASTTVMIPSVHTGAYHPNLGSGGGGKPVSIDLDGNGFHFTGLDDSNVFFDINGDGWKHRVSWPAAGDGLLAYDMDGDGKIDKAGEIQFAGYRAGAQTDLEGLRAFDSNGDGLFSAADAKWARFGVWQDASQNGVTDPGEFRTLEQMGVASIGLASDGRFSVVDGQTVHGVGSLTMADGSTLQLADVTLAYSDEVQVPNPDGTSRVVRKQPFSPSGEVLEGSADKDLILGKTGNNIIYAGAGDDVVFEDGGNDLIDAGDGDDLVYPGADNDIVIAGAGDDAVFAGLGDDLLLGGDGHDALFAEQGNDIVFGGDGNDLVSGDGGNDVLSGDRGDDAVYGGTGNDALFGAAGDDVLGGNEGHDRLDGGEGSDLLDGGEGADDMIGGTGDDIYVVDHAADTIAENPGEGVDTVRASIDYVLGANLEKLTLTGAAPLSGYGNELDNVLVGNAGSNILVGGAGNDILDGSLGGDTLAGGGGDDSYIVDNAGDGIVEAAGEGVDTVRAGVTHALAANVEKLVLTGSGAIDGTGNELDNVLMGNDGDNRLDGGLGTDILVGGQGDDQYVIDNASDTVVENAGEGSDTLFASVSYALPDNAENLVLTGGADVNAIGNGLDNRLTGNSGNNVLDGGAGTDFMSGGGGDDTYSVDNAVDVVVEDLGGGTDTVYASVSHTLSDNVENLALTGTADMDAIGNALDNRLIGNGGSNLLDGGGGADTLAGGAGDDTYVIDDVGDGVIENAAEGVDTVLSRVSYVLSANVENLTLTGSADIAGTGNELDNLLAGNAGNNILEGGAGADAMAGGAGDDGYIVDNLGDTVVETADAGLDSVLSSISFVLPEHVERLTLTGAMAINGTGNNLDNVLTGNDAANLLDGTAGADRMSGNGGDDVYYVDQVGDLVEEAAGGGYDTVRTRISLTAPEYVERLELLGGEALDATGNALDNVLVGNSGANRLDGGLGADAMMGGAGDDDYLVDDGQDAVFEAAFEGVDTIYSSVSYVLPEHVENLILRGNGNISAGGNGLDNVLTGNTGANLLSGGAGNDLLIGGTGDDTYLVNPGDGLDRIEETAGTDTVRFGAGLSLDNLALRVSESGSVFTARVRVLNAGGCEQQDQGFDFEVGVDARGGFVSPIERFQFADGSIKTFDDLLIKTRYWHPRPWQRTITTGRDDDVIYAGPRNDTIRAGTGHDTVYAGPGGDTVFGEGGDDYLQGATGDDVLDGGCGTDILAGAQGRDLLRDLGGNNALFGGQQDDRIEAGAGNDFIAGGKHDDTLQAGGGANVIAFNRSDGRDTILPGVGARNTLSLGGGIEAEDLRFRRSGQDLVLDAGRGDRITFKDWYALEANRNFVTLQLIDDGWRAPSGRKADRFDFRALVEAFDAAQAAQPRLSAWSLMNGLLDAHLGGSDQAALGGELAVRYAQDSLLTMSPGAVQQVLRDPGFGSQAQTVGSRFEDCVHRIS